MFTFAKWASYGENNRLTENFEGSFESRFLKCECIGEDFEFKKAGFSRDEKRFFILPLRL